MSGEGVGGDAVFAAFVHGFEGGAGVAEGVGEADALGFDVAVVAGCVTDCWHVGGISLLDVALFNYVPLPAFGRGIGIGCVVLGGV